MRELLVRVSCLLVSSALFAGDLLKDADMDGLEVGTAPDCRAPAGAWQFGGSYCESDAKQYAIVATDEFDDGAAGNSLGVRISGYQGNFHMYNTLIEDIRRSNGGTFVARFDIWVADGKNLAGGSMYIAPKSSDYRGRGPQLTWFPDGTIAAQVGTTDPDFVNITLLESYPRDAWQSWILRIDLPNQTFDAFYAGPGEEFVQVGNDVGYRAPNVAVISRVYLAHFGGQYQNTQAYFDRVRVYRDQRGDLNSDGEVDFNDIDPFVTALISRSDYEAAYVYGLYDNADIDKDGGVDFNDIDGFVDCLIDGGCK